MRIAGIRRTSMFDGFGIRYVIFTQGCAHHCLNCHNKSTWNFNGGHEVSIEDLQKDIEKYIGFIDGVTFSGGDPVYQLDEVLELAKWAKSEGLDTMLYTGFTLEDLECDGVKLPYIDYLMDGMYIQKEHTTELPFRGSANQVFYTKIPDNSLGDVWMEITGDELCTLA